MKNLIFLIGIIFLSSCSVIELIYFQDKGLKSSRKYDFNYSEWLSASDSEILILAIHGYNAHAGSFETPAKLFSKFNIETISFDLRGFGSNKDFGKWYPLQVHINDVDQVIKKISRKEPKKKIFLLGESMGAAIAISLANQKKHLPINGLILVSPAFWNFSDTNPFKSFLMKGFANLFPNFLLSGKGIIKVRPSDNIKMLKDYAADPLVVHKPTASSVNGIIELMDKAFNNAERYLNKPTYETLIVIPMIDEIVPRKPLIHLFDKININTNLNKNLFLALYDKNFHMILRDIDGDRITWEIKEWIINKERVINFQTFKNVVNRLKNAKFYHRLD